MNPREVRRTFLKQLFVELRVVWPILSALLLFITALGLIIGLLEGWSVLESIYFAFVSGLTIGYGDLAPKTVMTRMLALIIGACGILLTGVVAAIGGQGIEHESWRTE